MSVGTSDTGTRERGDAERPGTQDSRLRIQDSAPSTQHSAPSTRHRRPPRPAVLLALLAVAAAGWWYFAEQAAPPTRGIAASGTIEAEEISIAAEVGGRIAQILAAEGDQVRTGDPLIKLDDTVLRQQYRMASAAERPLLELQLDRMLVRSPLDGVVARRSLRVGEVASPGATVLVVTRQDPLELTLYVPERQIGRVQVGQQVEVRVDSFPKDVFPGTVTFIATKAEFTPRNVQTQQDRLNLVFAVKVRIPNADLRLKPGMPADATIVLSAES